MIKFAACADCRKPIARDIDQPGHCCEQECGWYHVKLSDTWNCPGTAVHIRPHIPAGMAMDTAGCLYPVAPDVPIGTGLSAAERIYEAALDATEARP
jgi:hypothetical protein